MRLLRKLEKERKKLNKLGEKSLEYCIPLSEDQEVLEQSRKVDELMARYHRMKAIQKQRMR
ncbi:hypothetical protein B1A99_19110 [Cohnella sp. CIP 111063]|uniref:Spo0E family sporulation regulatory protein-aspartic acid phosphatase n=1 Tax=unclassified Cohnella TaxID=2636738 RepID=UPI000B8C48DC|nr:MULTISPECIES: Spo0E family sporulation regulatory protein-aspartic acid phosphatase [unclassified Cohnella]OXS57014.1 hypothetical protein B1A99_19110 [Cohnella sp. CIP 111063]